MTQTILTIISIFFLSCNSNQSRKQASHSVTTNDSTSKEIATSEARNKQELIAPPDTTSSEYLIYLLKNGKTLNPHWTQKLDTLDGFFYMPQDTLSHLSIIRNWVINDSISVIILSNADGTNYDEFLITIKNKHDLVSNIHINDNDDRDLSFGNPYYYTEYKLINDRKVKLLNHKIVGKEDGNEKDHIISIETWTIQSNGKTSKNKTAANK